MNLSCYDLSWGSSEGGGLYLEALVKDDAGKRVEKIPAPFDPYCYIREDDLVMDPLRVTNCRIGEGAPEGFLKIEADHPSAIGDFRERFAFQTFEADVYFDTRVAVNEGVEFARPDRGDILYFDIEVDDRGDFAEPSEARDRIISIAGVSGDGEEAYFDGEDEKQLVRDFLSWADDYVALVGWNSVGYDFKYLDNRCFNLGMDVNWRRWARLDLMPLYDMLARPTETLETNLEATANRETEEGLATGGPTPGGGELYEAWESDPDALREYNMRDAEVLREIDQKYDGIVKLLYTIADIGGTPPPNTIYENKYGEVKFKPGGIVDAHILGVAHDRGVPMPNKGRHDTDGFPGADVLDPDPGFYSQVATLDYSGMYPNIVRAFNFGPTTWYEDATALREAEGDVEYIEGESGVFVHPDERRSIMAEAVDDLVIMREGAAEIVDRGVKVINNTLYGVTASPFHRYYLPGMSENITLVGQRLVRLAEEGADRSPDVEKVIYGDTDSVMVLMAGDYGDPRDLVDAAARAVEVVEETLREWAEGRGAVGDYLMLDIDDVYRKFFIGDKKKRYFGHRLWKGYWSNDVKIKGLEYVQGDVPEPAREFQRELIDVRLGFDDRGIGELVEKYKDMLYSGDIDAEMATMKGLGKPVDEYKADTPPVHARAAVAIREEFGEDTINVGSKVGYIKFGKRTEDWTWVHDGRTGRPLRAAHYEYLWSEKFEGVMESIGVDGYDQTALGAFI